MGAVLGCWLRGSAMRACVVALLLWLVLSSLPVAHAQGSLAPQVFARHKTGPVSIRGIASGVNDGGFSLKTTKHGTYAIVTRVQTQVLEKGKRGKIVLSEGDHVRVRGFLTGRVLTAMTIQIIPVKQKVKPFSVRGTVRSVSRTRLVLAAGSTSLTAELTSQTAVDGAATSLVGLHAADRVLVRLERLGNATVAVHIHVYKRLSSAHRVQLHGIVTGLTAGALTLVVGAQHYRVVVTSGTRFLQANAPASQHDLRAGGTITVYACCQGGTLTATSIHILKMKVHQTISTIRGTVTSLSHDQMRLMTSSGIIVVGIAASTPAALGSAPASVRDVRVGDLVTVRAARAGKAWKATRIHIFARSLRVRTLVGNVVSVSRSSIALDARGTRYTVSIGRSTLVSSGTVKSSLGSVHAGDRVKASGRMSGNTLIAQHVQITPAKLKLKTVRGVVRSVSSSGITMADANGNAYLVRPAVGVPVTLHGKPAPPGALFPGANIAARGRVSGSTVVASSITLSVQSRIVNGRVAGLVRGAIMVSSSRSTIWTLDLAGNPAIVDGRKAIRVSNLGTGAEIRAHGYLERTDRLRTSRIEVIHSMVTVSGTVVSTAGGIRIATASGQRYTLRLTAATAVSAERTALALTVADIPVGAHVKVDGTVGTDGTVKVDRIAVRLASFTGRGRVVTISTHDMTVRVATATVSVKIESATVVMQGTHALKLDDVVVADDVTVYGYRGVAVLARKLLVHRKRISATGSVTTLSSDGFTLAAADGSHEVIVSSATVVVLSAGHALAAGAGVKVSGYLRGDGAILATRITVK